MDKIRISTDDSQTYDINSIAYSGDNLLVVEFISDIPKSFDEFDLLTESDTVYGHISGFNTLYKQDDNIITLSNDGSVYVEPSTVASEPAEPKELTEEEKATIERQKRISEINSELTQIDNEFKELDYIGIKIATGRATIDEYTEEIARMTELADKKNELENELKELQEVSDNG